MKEYQYFRVELEGHIATITISRPKALNALSWDLVTELETVIDDVSAMEDVWVVIFTGDGDKAFVAGGDIKEMYVMNPEKALHIPSSAPASCTKSKTCPSLPSQQSMVTHSAAALR